MALQSTFASFRAGRRVERSRSAATRHRRRDAFRTTRIVAFLIVAAFVSPFVRQAAMADSDRGAQLAASCASCHRPDGRDDGIPPVVGVDQESLASALLAYKSGQRESQIMHAVATSLSDDEIAIVTRYLAAQGKNGKQP
ncbi:MAG TPA: c-type cytochrome [Candidatus Angelobacter sp.]|nr:c-type cytochrome [Candidatus Angelobacter sp.]